MSRLAIIWPRRSGLQQAIVRAQEQVTQLARDYAVAYDITEADALDVILRTWGVDIERRAKEMHP